MKFNINQVYTPLYADDVKLGSGGYFADSLTELKRKVQEGGPVTELAAINGEDAATRFCASSVSSYFLFYLVDKPKEKKFRPYKDTTEMECGVADCVYCKDDNSKLMIAGIKIMQLYISSIGWINMQELFTDYEWPNGKPCGVEVTDEED